MTRYTHGVGTASWIDKAIKLDVGGLVLPHALPVNDGSGPPGTLTRGFFQACRGFRFANFLEVGIEVEGARIIRAGFTPDSRGYFGDSLFGKASHDYRPRRTMTQDGDDRVFTQIVGARTVGQEEVGGGVGGIVGAGIVPGLSPLAIPIGRRIGKAAARRLQPFAPIWSELEIRLAPDGGATSCLRRYSLFPSLTYYEQQTQGADTLVTGLQRVSIGGGMPCYNGTQSSMENWLEHGWGMVRGGDLGPTPGNPWGIVNDGQDRELGVAA